MVVLPALAVESRLASRRVVAAEACHDEQLHSAWVGFGLAWLGLRRVLEARLVEFVAD
jgi:hypothetical protein